jgi:hypothetical protein
LGHSNIINLPYASGLGDCMEMGVGWVFAVYDLFRVRCRADFAASIPFSHPIVHDSLD